MRGSVRCSGESAAKKDFASILLTHMKMRDAAGSRPRSFHAWSSVLMSPTSALSFSLRIVDPMLFGMCDDDAASCADCRPPCFARTTYLCRTLCASTSKGPHPPPRATAFFPLSSNRDACGRKTAAATRPPRARKTTQFPLSSISSRARRMRSASHDSSSSSSSSSFAAARFSSSAPASAARQKI